MAKQQLSVKIEKPKKKRKGIHAKSKTSSSKNKLKSWKRYNRQGK